MEVPVWWLLALIPSSLAAIPDDEALLAEIQRAEAPGVEVRWQRTAFKGGDRWRGQPEVDGLPVFDASFTGVIRGGDLVRRGRFSLPSVSPRSALLSSEEAAEAATEAAALLGRGSWWAPQAEAGWITGPDGLRRAYRVRASVAEPPMVFEVLVDAVTGDKSGFRMLSAEARGNVYDPNPIVAGVSEVTLDRLTDGTGLFGKYADVYSCDDWLVGETLLDATLCYSASRHAVPDSNGDFLFESDPASLVDPFLETNLYYHVDHVAEWARIRYGFEHGVPLKVYGNFGMENAFFGDFDGDFVPDLAFGQSEDGIDYGYDADVVYHEFGHSIVAGISTLGSLGADSAGLRWDGGSLNEGTADAISIFVYSDPDLGDYAGTSRGGTGPIRDLRPDRRCPDDTPGEVHDDGLVWGSLVWNLVEDPSLRPQTVADLVYGAVATWDGQTGWGEAGASLLESADDLFEVGEIDEAGVLAVRREVERANLIGCERYVGLDPDAGRKSTTLWMPNLGLTGDFGRAPAQNQIRVDAGSEHEALVVRLTAERPGSVVGLKGVVMARKGEPVGHNALIIPGLGLAWAQPETFDAEFEVALDGSGEAVLDEAAGLTPGAWYFSLATEPDGAGPVGFRLASVTVEVERITKASATPRYAGGCSSGGSTEAGFGALVLAIAATSLRARRRIRG